VNIRPTLMKMYKRFPLFLALIAFVTVILMNLPVATNAQTAGIATATPVTAGSSRPSAIQVKQQILVMQQKQLQTALNEIQRCIKQASEPTTLRDPQGNFNLVPQTDLVNCTRGLATIQRQVAALTRTASQLGSDARAQGIRLQRQADNVARTARIQAASQLGR
jgi:hypothetical protein